MLRPRFSSGKHTFDFPMLLSDDASDLRLVLTAHLLPPLLGLAVHRWLLRPLWRRHRVTKVRNQFRFPCP